MTTETRAAPTRPGAILIGGSAGALDPVGLLLEGLPDELTSPVVVVLHLPRRLPSLLAETLAHKTRRPVREPQDKEPLASGTVYVGAPDYHLLIADGPSFAFSVEEAVNFSIPSIDVLFESGADVLGASAVAVLLSGASTDGAAGLRAVVEAGGLGLVQDPAEAESPVMPDAAARGCPGARVCSVVEMRRHLGALAPGSRRARP